MARIRQVHFVRRGQSDFHLSRLSNSSCVSTLPRRVYWILRGGILISYVLNARFVFKEELRITKAMQYPIVYVSQYLLGMALLYLLVEIGHVSSSLAPLVIPMVTVPATFILS